MANNEILPFAGTDNGTNLLTQAEYNADSQRPIGNQPGVARSKLVNKVLRQTSLIAAAVAQFLANRQNENITDSLSVATLANYMLNAIGGDVQKNSFNSSIASGPPDAITASYTPIVTTLTNGLSLFVRALSANTSPIPTFTPNSASVPAKSIVKGPGLSLDIGDIAGAGHWLHLQYDSTLEKWVLQNPAYGVRSGLYAVEQAIGTNTILTASDLGKSFIGANESPFSAYLPLTSTCPAGGRIQFSNINSGSMTLVRQGPDVINHGSERTSIVLLAGSCVTLESGANGNWYVVNSSDGALQTLQTVVGSRSLATTYTNSTGRPIYVTFSALAFSGGVLVVNVNATQLLAVTGATGAYVSGTFKVPSGATYSIAASSGTFALNTWWETR